MKAASVELVSMSGGGGRAWPAQGLLRRSLNLVGARGKNHPTTLIKSHTSLVALAGFAAFSTWGAPETARAAALESLAEQSLRAAANRFDRAQLSGDRAALEAMTHAELIFVNGDGARAGRAEFISGWLDPGVRFGPVQITDQYLVLIGANAGIVGGEVVLRGTANGAAFNSRIRFADTFRLVAGEWRAVHIQVTRVR